MEHSAGWYLWQTEWSTGIQEPEAEAEKNSQLEEDHPFQDPPWPLPRTPQCELPVPPYEGPCCFQDWNPPVGKRLGAGKGDK